MTHFTIRFSVIMLILTSMGGCTSPAPRMADTHYNIETSVPPTRYGTEASIQLRKLDMRGIQSSRALVIISATDPIQLQENRGHYWHSAPALLLKRTISETLDSASYDIRFGTNVTMQDPDYTMDIDMRLFAFTPDAHAIVEMGFVIRNQDDDIVLHDVLRKTASLDGVSSLDGVHGLQIALAKTLEALSARLACHVTSSKISTLSKC
ncbi:ABC-type transport auxiliary lipoprotein family protein [Candidatus Puniceispirillum sp.]|uniref:ABC-type transport auxiliary lipoprotein family protein n=1 Tax=Candidatus Puniceispirillum sp. TaxID=2026719 RepID=UPI003F6A154D